MVNDSTSRYGTVTKALHWLSAFFIMCAMLIGTWFAWTDLDTDYGWEQFELYINWHVGFGFTVLILMLPRLVWRLKHSSLVLLEDDDSLQTRLAQSAHALLYAFGILTPLTGWLGSSLEGHTLHYFSILEIEPFFGINMELALLMTEAHFYLSWGFVALLSLHLSAVIYHQFWSKDRVLHRMWL